MDLLFSRYASPFTLLDYYIEGHRLTEFIFEFVKLDTDRRLWEFYVHKVFGKSFDEFKNDIKNESAMLNYSEEDLETTINESKSILDNFNPT